MIRPLGALAAALTLTVTLLGGCGPVVVKCHTSNCQGCCAGQECIEPARQSGQACGSDGQSCQACGAGMRCLSGRCGPEADGGSDAGVCGILGWPCCDTRCEGVLICSRGVCSFGGAGGGSMGGQLGSTGGTRGGTSGGLAGGQVGGTSGAGGGGSSLLALGSRCSASSDCADGLCQLAGFPEGYCTRECTTQADCPTGQCGLNPIGGPQVCLAECAAPGQAPGGCRAGYVCDRSPTLTRVAACWPACSGATRCGAASSCDGRGLCCGASGYACCDGGACSGATCNPASGYCAPSPCGELGQPCCAGSVCGPQGWCSGNVCVPCGALGHPCCPGFACGSGLTCRGGTCEVCGAIGQPCCSGRGCSSGACVDGLCRLATGEACAGPEQCAEGVCLGGIFVSGYCSQLCSSINSVCGPGTACSPYAAAGGSFCLRSCTWDGGAGECRSGYICDRGVIGVDPNQSACFPACTSDAMCLSGPRRCEGGFCCGAPLFRCCHHRTPACQNSVCVNDYCQP